MKKTDFGINWSHEYAIARWESEQSFKNKGSKGDLEAWIKFRSKFVRSKVFGELRTGHSSDTLKNTPQKRKGTTISYKEGMVGIDPEETDKRKEFVLKVINEAKLTEKEYRVFTHYLSNGTLDEIHKHLGISKRWSYILRRHAMVKIHDTLVKRGIIKRMRPYTSREML